MRDGMSVPHLTCVLVPHYSGRGYVINRGVKLSSYQLTMEYRCTTGILLLSLIIYSSTLSSSGGNISRRARDMEVVLLYMVVFHVGVARVCLEKGCYKYI